MRFHSLKKIIIDVPRNQSFIILLTNLDVYTYPFMPLVYNKKEKGIKDWRIRQFLVKIVPFFA